LLKAIRERFFLKTVKLKIFLSELNNRERRKRGGKISVALFSAIYPILLHLRWSKWI